MPDFDIDILYDDICSTNLVDKTTMSTIVQTTFNFHLLKSKVRKKLEIVIIDVSMYSFSQLLENSTTLIYISKINKRQFIKIGRSSFIVRKLKTK